MVAIWRDAAPVRRHSPVKRALYTEQCEDDEGNRYAVVVWRDWPGLAVTSYTLQDGTPLRYEDECHFALPSGTMLTRCADR